MRALPETTACSRRQEPSRSKAKSVLEQFPTALRKFAFGLVFLALPVLAEHSETVGGIVFVHLAGGCFAMGSPVDEKDRDYNENQHRVCIKPFAIGKFEISNEEYRRFRPGHQTNPDHSDPSQPAGEVTWHMARAYANWLSRKTGRRIRLPTEAEWEYAARGGTQTSHPWGNRSASGLGLSACGDCGTQWDGKRTAPAGSLPPNPFGLHDMLGNVWEWTCSAYDPDYQGSELRCSDDLTIDTRVRRGGGYADSARTNRPAYRSRAPLDYFNLPVGFRLVLETQGPGEQTGRAGDFRGNE